MNFEKSGLIDYVLLVLKTTAMMNNTINKKPITIAPILIDHIKKYPLLTIQDIYKLICQAALGPEHLITDKDVAYKNLCTELKNINDSFSQPLYENIDPREQLVRVYLNPFRQSQGNPEKIFEAFYQTSMTFYPEIGSVKIYCEQTIHYTEKKILPFEISDMTSFFHLKESQNFPVVHHSDIYRKSYQPAYRLISKNLLYLLD